MRAVLTIALLALWCSLAGAAVTASAPMGLDRLPAGPDWRTFAKPLPLDRSRLLLFQRDGARALLWRIDWAAGTVNTLPLPELKLDGDGRYTVLASRHGLWFLGETVLLIRPNGQRLKLNLSGSFNEPVAVVLADQSVLVLGTHGGGESGPRRMLQLRPQADFKQLLLTDRGPLAYATKEVSGYGHSAVTLRDGRVLMLGGYRTSHRAGLLTPSAAPGAWAFQPAADMPHERVKGAAQTLPDGRVAVIGAPHLSCYGEAASVRSVDVYDVTQNRWSSLPPLPFVPCADAYGSDSPALAVTPQGRLVVGAHLEPELMVLPRQAGSATGYAASWQVQGRLLQRRIGGVVQALSEREVVMAGGVDRRDSCCYATAGVDRLSLLPGATPRSLAMSLLGAGAARRGPWLFVASGRRFGFTGTGQMRYSAHAELIDLASGQPRQLPNVPFASGAAKAVWLDDNRILLKGVREAEERGFALNDNLSSYLPHSSGAMAVFQVKENRWSAPLATPELEAAQLLGAEGGKALLLTARQEVLRLDPLTGKSVVVQRALRGRRAGIARLLAGGRLVLAGGEAQSDMVSVLDPACGADCPERFVGFGPYIAQAQVEVLPLGDKTIAPPMFGAPGPDHVISTAIGAQGRVMVLAQDRDLGSERNHGNEPLSLARSSADGQSWERLPVPLELQQAKEGRCDRCALLLAADPRQPGRELLFLREGAIDADYSDDEIEAQAVRIWWWDEAGQGWQPVLRSAGLSSRARPLALGGPLSPQQGKRLISMGWHLPEPVLWLEP